MRSTRIGSPVAAPEASKVRAHTSPVVASNQAATVTPEALVAICRPPPASERRCVPGIVVLTCTSADPLEVSPTSSTPA